MKTDVNEFINRVTKDASDQGRLIEVGWLSLRAMAIPDNASDIQVREMRKAFFAGAQHLYASIMGILDPGQEPTEADMSRMRLIDSELRGWYEDMKKEAGL